MFSSLRFLRSTSFLIGCVLILIVGAYFFYVSSETIVSENSLPNPFFTTSTLRGYLQEMGSRSGTRMSDVLLEPEDSTLPFVAGTAYLVSVPPSASGVVPLTSLLPTRAKFYGYAYSKADSNGNAVVPGQRERDASARLKASPQTPFTYAERFPGQFFVSEPARSEPKISLYESTLGIAFVPSLSEVNVGPGDLILVMPMENFSLTNPWAQSASSIPAVASSTASVGCHLEKVDGKDFCRGSCAGTCGWTFNETNQWICGCLTRPCGLKTGDPPDRATCSGSCDDDAAGNHYRCVTDCKPEMNVLRCSCQLDPSNP